MCLVVVSAFISKSAETHGGIVLQRVKGSVEPDDAHKLFGAAANVLIEYPLELFFAQAYRLRRWDTDSSLLD